MDTFINKERRYNLLFICLGNICRSPAADAVMHHLTDSKGLSHNFTIDSAGIGNWQYALDLIEDGCKGLLETIIKM